MNKQKQSIYADIFRQPTKKELRDFLIKIPLFKGIRKSEIMYLVGLFYKRTFNAGEVVFVEGDLGHAMYIILEGQVNILKSIKKGRKKVVQEVATLKRKSFFGEMSLLTDEPRSATASIPTQTTLLCFFKKDLDHIISKHPSTGLKLMKNLATVLATRLQTANKHLEEISGR